VASPRLVTTYATYIISHKGGHITSNSVARLFRKAGLEQIVVFGFFRKFLVEVLRIQGVRRPCTRQEIRERMSANRMRDKNLRLTENGILQQE